MQTLNNKYMEFKNGLASLDELKELAYEEIYFHRNFFGLQKLSEDDFSDFFVYFYPKLDTIILSCDTTKSMFSSHLYRCLMYQNHAWYHRQNNFKCKDKSINLYAIEDYNERICSQEPDYYVKEKKSQKRYLVIY